MINKVIISGAVADLKVTFDADGKPQTSFTSWYEQPYQDGQRTAKLFIPVDVAPRQAESVAEAISDGAVVLIDGSLKWRSWMDKKGERQGKLAILTWSLLVVTPAMVASEN